MRYFGFRKENWGGVNYLVDSILAAPIRETIMQHAQSMHIEAIITSF